MEDSVQEKLNQLKRIASERKAAHLNKTNEANQQEQEKFVKFVRNKLNNFIGNGRTSPEPERAEKQNKFKLQYQASVEQLKKEKDESLLLEKSAKLQKELEEAGVLCEDDTSDSKVQRRISIDNGNKNGSSSSIELNDESHTSLKETFSSEIKKPLKSILVQNQPADIASNKYVNRIKNLYDKERSSSTEVINNNPFSKNPNRFMQQRSKTQDLTEQPISSQSIEIPSDQFQRSKTEYLESSAGAPSSTAGQMSNESKPKPPRTYVQSLLDTFNLNNSNRDKDDLAKLIEQNGNYNQLVDSLREKFDDKSQRTKSSRSPSLIPNENNLNDHQVEESNAQPTTSTKKRPSLRYRKAETLDLTDYIFDKEAEEKKAKTSEIINRMNSIKFDKFDKVSAAEQRGYTKELTSQIKEQFAPTKTNTNTIKKSESSMIQKPTKDELRYLTENNRIMLTLGKYGDGAPPFIQEKALSKERSTEPIVSTKKEVSPKPTVIVEPSSKKTKSILKLPSNFSERTICFDERVDVIPIDSNDNNSSIPNSRLSPMTPNYLQVQPQNDMTNTGNKKQGNTLEVNQEDYLRGSPLRSSLKKSGSSNRLERNRSPAPMREIPGVIVPDTFNNNLLSAQPFPIYNNIQDIMGDESPRNPNSNNRNRFIKKKMTNRSKSVETPAYNPDDTNFMEFDAHQNNRKTSVPAKPLQYNENIGIGKMLSRNPFIVNNNKMEIPTIIISNDRVNANRPTLARQNAVNKSFTKSLGDNLNRLQDVYRSPPKILPNDRYARHSHNYQDTDRSQNSKRNRKYRRPRRKNYASSSLTSSLSTESEDSMSYSTTESSLTSSSEFSPRENTLSLQRFNKSRNQTGYDNYSMNRARNAKTEEKQLRHPNKYAEKFNYSSDDSVCGIPKPGKISLCSGSKPFHRSMDELSYSKQVQSNPNEIEQIESTNTLPINPAIFKNKSTNQQSDNSISSNNNSNNQGNLIQSNSVNKNSGNSISKPIFNESQKAYPSSKKDGQKSHSISNEPNVSNMIASKSIRPENINGGKVTYNHLGQPVHPGLKPVSKALPTYNEIMNEAAERSAATVQPKPKASTFRDQLLQNSLYEKSKINANYHLNVKNQFLPFNNSNQQQTASANNVSVGNDDFDQKRISSLSPSNIAGFNEKNIMVNKNKQQKNLPSYSSYIASKNGSSLQPKTPTTLNSGMTLSGYQPKLDKNDKQNEYNKYNKSKSFDTGHFEQDSTENTPIYPPSLYEQNQRHQDDETMPQSAAIQEKLRRFEPSISTPTDSSKPFGLFNSNEAADKQRKDLILGRSLIDENQNNDMNRLASPRQTSPFETNKENSPFSGKSKLHPAMLQMFQSTPASLSQSSHSASTSGSNQFNQNSVTAQAQQQQQQQPAQKTERKNPYLNDPTLFLKNMGYVPNKNGIGFTKETSASRGSPGRTLLNQPVPKYAHYSSTSNQFNKATSTPPQINSSLAAATAAASAAVAAVTTPTQQPIATNQFQAPSNNSLKNSKNIRSDYSLSQMCSGSPSLGYNNDNYEYMSLQSNNNFNNNQTRSDREKSFDSQTQNNYNLLNSPSTQGPSIVSKRAALFEQNQKRVDTRTISPHFQSLDSTSHLSYARSNLSPLSKVSKFEEQPEITPSSSGGASASSFKQDNKRQILESQTNNSFKRVQQQQLTNENQMDIGMDTDAMNPGMSISERMKMLNNNNPRPVDNENFEIKSTNKRNASNYNNNYRFQTQPVSQADFNEISNDNFTSHLAKQPQTQQQQQQAQQYQPTVFNTNSNHNRSFHEFQYSATSDSTSSPSSLTSSTSSTNSNHEEIPAAIIRKSIQSLNLEKQQITSNNSIKHHVNPILKRAQLMKKSNSINITNFPTDGKTSVQKMKTESNEILNSSTKPTSVMELKKSFVVRNQETQKATIEPIVNTYLIKEMSPKHIPIHKVHQQESAVNQPTIMHEIKARDESIENNIFLLNDKKPGKPKFQNSIRRFETNNNSDNNNYRFETTKKSPVLEASRAEDDHMNRSRTKSKADESNFTSLPAELALKKQSPGRDNMSDDDENSKPAPKTIQERMAALKRQQTNEWKKPNGANNTSQEGSSPTKNAFKQNQMQLRQQLLMATPNSATPYQLLKEKNKDMGSLDNNDDFKEDHRLSNESLDNDTEESLPAPKPKTTKPKSMFNAELEKALSFKAPGSKQRQLSNNNPSETSDKPEMFSTDSEMDSFFKDKNKYDDLFSSSCGSPSRTDENLIDELDDDFDKIKSSQMLTQGTRAKPVRKTKSKGNHLKNLQNRTEVSSEYDQQPQPASQTNQPFITPDLLQKRLSKQSSLINT